MATMNIEQKRDDHLILKDATKFLGEIQVTLSALLIISSIAVISVFSLKIQSCDECEHPLIHQHMIGLVTFSSVIIGINIFDIISAFFLISGSNNLNICRCQYWCLATETTLILFSIVTMIFIFVLEDWLLFLALLPSLLLKPLGLWIVKGFIFKLQQMQIHQKIQSPDDSGSSSVSPQSGSSSSWKPSLKPQRTTVFLLNRDNDNSRKIQYTSYQKIAE